MKYSYGLDVSGWDQVVDWNKLKGLGLTFTFVKAGEGLWTDNAFHKNWPLAKDAGFLRGAYHFYDQDPDATAQAQSFLKNLQADPGELPPVVDVEHEKDVNGRIIPVTNPPKYMSHLHTLLAVIEAAIKRPPLIYTSWGFWNEVTANSGGAPAWAAHYPLWIAHYPNSLYSTPNLLLPASNFQALARDIEGGSVYRGFPTLPSGWKTWNFWQFSAEKFFLDGLATMDEDHKVVQAKSDLDVFPGSMDELRAWAGLGPAEAITGVNSTIPDSSSSSETNTGSAEPDGTAKTVPHITNQAMINVFLRAFGEPGYFDIAKAAGLESMAVPESNRSLMYSGPAIEDLPLSDDQKVALIRAIP